MPFPRVTPGGAYPKWDGNTEFDKACLLAVGLPEDYHPTEEEAYRIIEAAMEND